MTPLGLGMLLLPYYSWGPESQVQLTLSMGPFMQSPEEGVRMDGDDDVCEQRWCLVQITL